MNNFWYISCTVVLFILTPSAAGLLHRNTVSTGVFRDRCRAQGNGRRDTV